MNIQQGMRFVPGRVERLRRTWSPVAAVLRNASVILAVVGLAMGLGYSTSQALPGACAVELNVHPGAWILLHHHPIARCTSGGGCKCGSCYNLDGSVYSACYPLVAPIPGY